MAWDRIADRIAEAAGTARLKAAQRHLAQGCVGWQPVYFDFGIASRLAAVLVGGGIVDVLFITCKMLRLQIAAQGRGTNRRDCRDKTILFDHTMAPIASMPTPKHALCAHKRCSITIA